jgi:RNA-directed DNA polymerase
MPILVEPIHYKGRRYPRRKSIAKLRDSIRGKTRRTNGQSLKMMIGAINRTLQGWFHYFQHSSRQALRDVDSWIRMRLRSMLRKRQGRRGRGRGADHNRWPNAFFADQGLFSLQTAHELVCQSSLR